jgi:hypothetical protein
VHGDFKQENFQGSNLMEISKASKQARPASDFASWDYGLLSGAILLQ